MAFKNSKAFTIVELMIAISVFSLAISLVTAGIIQVGRYYQQGVTKAKIINISREVQSKVAQDYQYSGANPLAPTGVVITNPIGLAGTYNALCVGVTRYLYVPNTNKFVVDTITGTSVCSSDNSIDAKAQTPLPTNAKVTDFSFVSDLTKGAGVYVLTTRFVIGEIDLFGGNFSNNCDLKAGREFCAVILFKSDIVRKVQG